MLKKDKTGTQEENFSHHCIQDGQIDKRIKSEASQNKTCWVQLWFRTVWKEHPFVAWFEKSQELNPHFFLIKKLSLLIMSSTNRMTFTADHVVNKQNNRVTAFENYISKHRKVSTTNHSASIVMIGVVVSNGEKKLPVWLKRDYRLTSAVYKEILETKVIPWVTKKSDYVFHQGGKAVTYGKCCAKLVGQQHELLFQRLLTFYSHQIWILLISSCGFVLKKMAKKARHSNINEVKASVNRAWRPMRRGFVSKVYERFRSRVARIIAVKGSHIE